MHLTDFSKLKLTELKEFAAVAGITLPAGARKAEIIAFLDEAQRKAHEEEKRKESEPLDLGETEVNDNERVNPKVPDMLSSGDCGDCCGVLELHPDGYGFLRSWPFEFARRGIQRDVYVSIAQIRRFNLRTGDKIVGKTRPLREGEKYAALLYVVSINGIRPDIAAKRRRFENLVPVYPDKRLRLEDGQISNRMIDLIAPVGKGQRSMIVAQPKSGKTMLLKAIASAIESNHPECELMVLLVDERPEEVTDFRRSIKSEVICSTFDEMPENHIKVAEMVLERAERLVEHGKDVVILLDSITRLARAYNLTIDSSGKVLSGGIDPGALYKPKRFFGAARNIEGGGSLTILATALVETGSRMDDIIYEEFKGTGNSELHLDRHLAQKRIYPAIDILRSGTRRDDLLLSENEMLAQEKLRKRFAERSAEQATSELISMLKKSENNLQLIENLTLRSDKK